MRSAKESCAWAFAAGVFALGLGPLPATAAAPAPAQPAAAPAEFTVFARVSALIDASHLAIDRGALDGLRVGQDDPTVHPFRPTEGSSEPRVDAGTRLARAKVAQAAPHQATLELRLVADAIQPGDLVQYNIRAPPFWVDEPLLLVAARCGELVDLQDKPVYSLAELLADPTPSNRDALLDRFAAALQAMEPVAKQARAKLEQAGIKTMPGGQFKGLHLDEALAATKRSHVAAYLRHVADNPADCTSPKIMLLMHYALWAAAGTPEPDPALAKAEKLAEQASEAANRGQLGEAETHLRAALKLAPDSTQAKEALRKLEQIRIWKENLRQDPDDTATRMSLMVGLYQQGAYDLALAEIAKLEKAGYQLENCLAYRAFVLRQRQKFGESAQLFQQILQNRKDAPYQSWLKFAMAREALQKAPQSFEAQVQLAGVHEEDREFNSARDAWQLAMDWAKSPAQLKLAIAGQRRVALLRKVVRVEAETKDLIAGQQNQPARKMLKALRNLCDQTGDTRCALDVLGRLATAAQQAELRVLALELRAERVQLAPDRADLLRELAWHHYATGDAAAANPFISKALQLDPREDYGHVVAAWVASAQGQWQDARREATLAARDKQYAWPRQLLTQLAMMDGDYPQAVQWAKEGLALAPDQAELGRAHAAAHMARQAAAEIAAGKEVVRNQLRLVRALVWVDAPQPAWDLAKAMPAGDPLFREAMWAIAQSPSPATPLALRLAAAQAAQPATPVRQARLRWLELQAQFEAQPKEPAVALAYAQACIRVGEFRRALAALGQESATFAASAGQAPLLEAAARSGLEAEALLAATTDASNRSDHDSQYALGTKAGAMFAALQVYDRAGLAISQAAAALSSLGRYKEAIALLQPPLGQLAAHGDESTRHLLAKQSQAYAYMLGDLEGFSRAVAEASQAALNADDLFDQCSNLIQRSGAAADEGRTRQALADAQRAREIADLLGHQGLARSSMRAIAANLLDLGDLPQARQQAEQLLRASRRALASGDERFSLLLLGVIAMRQGNLPVARQRFDDVYALGVRSADSDARAKARVFAGDLALDGERDAKAAVPLLQQAASLYQTLSDQGGELHARLSLTRAHLRENDLPAARKHVDRALVLARHPAQQFFLPLALATLADVLVREGKPSEAVPLAREASQLAESRDLPSHLMQAQHSLGMALQATKADPEAALALERAAVLASQQLARGGQEEREGQLAFGDTREVFRDAIDLLIRLGKVERALELLEMSRDANLRKIFDPSRLKAQDGKVGGTLDDLKSTAAQNAAAKKALSEELAKPKELQSGERVKALAERVAGTDGELRQLLARLKRDHRQLYALLAITPESITELRESLPPDAIVLEFFSASDALYAFVISRDKQNVRAYKVPVSAQELESTVVAFRQALQQGGRSRGKAPGKALRGSQPLGLDESDAPDQTAVLGRKLYDWLLAPVEQELAGAKTTLIVPFGPLYYLPFHALVLPESAGGGSGGEKGAPVYAIERHRLSYLSSTTIFKLLKRQKSTDPKTLLAFANPDGSLPGARAEIERVRANSFPQAKVLFEQAATKGRFFELASQYRIIHFATHGVLDRDPLASYLKMAKDPLTVDEITGFSGLEDKTDLVVLSACETALEAGHSNGDEVISIASAFATAGAPALVASLWAVDDAATSELMSEFYRVLQSTPPVDTLEALRQAQIHVLRFQKDGKRVFAAPGFWAAFELIGDYR
jgi:CHAT domain-containing protein